jgi:Cytochrome c oxidase subunit IV
MKFLTLNRSVIIFTVAPKNLPVTMNPEHVAAQRAYMRYHNMNPIFGISSKRARSADPDP